MIKAITELVYTTFRGVDIVGFHCFTVRKERSDKQALAVRETGQHEMGWSLRDMSAHHVARCSAGRRHSSGIIGRTRAAY